MAHGVFGKRFLGMREPAWHNLGKVIPDGMKISVEEALRIGNIDFEYRHVPMGYTTPSGEFVQSGERHVILRSPTSDDPQWRELGVVSNDYDYIQNIELARGLDQIAQQTGWRFETVGALDMGRTVFLSLRTGQRSVLGDSYDTYLIVSDGKANDRALTISVAPVRVVCMNTLVASDGKATAKVRITHDQFVHAEYDYWLGLIEQLERAQDATFADLTAMASAKIDEKTAVRIIEAAMPLPGKTQKAQAADGLLGLRTDWTPEQRAKLEERTTQGEDRKQAARWQVLARRGAALELYQRFNLGQEQGALDARAINEMPRATLEMLRETPYAVVQAISELVDHGGIARAEIAAASAMFGLGADVKRRAWDAAMHYAAK